MSVGIQLKFCSFEVLKFDHEKFIDLNRFSVTVVTFFVWLQADHLIISKQLIKKVFCLNYFLLLPICFVLLSKKFLQLAGFFIPFVSFHSLEVLFFAEVCQVGFICLVSFFYFSFLLLS